jgi:hypothetical protein
MDTNGLETESKSIERAVDLLDHLLYIADGGRAMVVGQYEASTILALLMDKPYRVDVMSRLDDFVDINREE